MTQVSEAEEREEQTNGQERRVHQVDTDDTGDRYVDETSNSVEKGLFTPD